MADLHEDLGASVLKAVLEYAPLRRRETGRRGSACRPAPYELRPRFIPPNPGLLPRTGFQTSGNKARFDMRFSRSVI